MKLLWELKNIPSLLIEVNIKQLKKQNPGLEQLVDGLINRKVDNKYLQWAVIMAKKHRDMSIEEYIDLFVELTSKFESFSRSGKFKKAIKMKLIGQKQANIQFWHREDLEDFKDFLERMEEFNLESRRDIKASDSDLVYKDERIVMYSPHTQRASCILGSNTKWCISGREGYFDRYTSEGKVFIFVIDKAFDPEEVPLAKIAMVYDAFERDLDEMYDAEDDQIGYMEAKEHYGKYFDKIKKEADSYIRNKRIKIKRAPGDFWYGDRVAYGEWYISDISYGYGNFPEEWGQFKDFLSDFFGDFRGYITDPMRVNSEEEGSDATVYVEWEVPQMQEKLDQELEYLLESLVHEEPEEPDTEEPEKPDINDFDSDEEYDKAYEKWDEKWNDWYDERDEWNKRYKQWEKDQDKVDELYDVRDRIADLIDKKEYTQEEHISILEIIRENWDLEDVVKKFRG